MKTETPTYCRDISRLRLVKVSDEEKPQLEKDLEAFFQPKTDPQDMSKETRLKAEEELFENPSTLYDHIGQLRDLIEADPDLHGRTDDVTLSSFLRGKKHNITRAFQSYRNAYEFKGKYPEYYGYLNDEDFPILANQTHIGSLPGVDKKGRKLFVIQAGNIDLNVPFNETFKIATTYMELMLSDVDIQVNGFVVLIDLANFSLMHKARLVNPTNAWHISLGLQDKMPMRVKMVHFVNQPFYFKALYTVFKPFLRKKLKKRIKLYGDNWEALHEEIAPEHLPREYGGTRPSFTTKLTMSILELHMDKFKDWSRYYLKLN